MHWFKLKAYTKRNPAAVQFYVAARRIGKSTAIAKRALEAMLKGEQQVVLMRCQGKHLSQYANYFEPVFRLWPKWRVAFENKFGCSKFKRGREFRTLQLENNVEVAKLASLDDPDSVKSSYITPAIPTLLILDEFFELNVDLQTFNQHAKNLYEILFSATTRSGNGFILPNLEAHIIGNTLPQRRLFEHQHGLSGNRKGERFMFGALPSVYHYVAVKGDGYVNGKEIRYTTIPQNMLDDLWAWRIPKPKGGWVWGSSVLATKGFYISEKRPLHRIRRNWTEMYSKPQDRLIFENKACEDAFFTAIQNLEGVISFG